MEKACKKCGQSKLLTEYSKQKACKDGYANMCKACFREYQREYRAKNKDRYNTYQAEYRKANSEVRRWRDLAYNTAKRMDLYKKEATHKMLRYSPQELKEHLDSLGMNWNTDSIDHRIPLSWFKEGTPIHIVNDLRNLQPLPFEENVAKRDTYASEVPEDYLAEVSPYLKEDKLPG